MRIGLIRIAGNESAVLCPCDVFAYSVSAPTRERGEKRAKQWRCVPENGKKILEHIGIKISTYSKI